MAPNNFNPKEKPMNRSESKINRRQFLQKGVVVAAGGATLSSTALSYTRTVGAQDRISLGDSGMCKRGRELVCVVQLRKYTETPGGTAGLRHGEANHQRA